MNIRVIDVVSVGVKVMDIRVIDGVSVRVR